jgi:hypothetical protein
MLTSLPATLADVLAPQGDSARRSRVGSAELPIRSRRDRDHARLVLAKVRWKRQLVRLEAP